MIKYRVWDSEQKRYLNNRNVSISGDGILRVTTYEDGYNTIIAQSPNEKSPRFIVEQYTGLKDKDGVEICQGDIVRHRGYHGATISPVVFSNGCFNVGMHQGSSTKVAPMLLNSKTEIVGNIHENADLLEEK